MRSQHIHICGSFLKNFEMGFTLPQHLEIWTHLFPSIIFHMYVSLLKIFYESPHPFFLREIGTPIVPVIYAMFTVGKT